MNELDKLETYLKEHGYAYIRRRRAWDTPNVEKHSKSFGEDYGEQIVVYDEEGARSWDAIWGYGSYGYPEGLLEAMGSAVVRVNDSVEGFLTAEEVIRRLEEW